MGNRYAVTRTPFARSFQKGRGGDVNGHIRTSPPFVVKEFKSDAKLDF